MPKNIVNKAHPSLWQQLQQSARDSTCPVMAPDLSRFETATCGFTAVHASHDLVMINHHINELRRVMGDPEKFAYLAAYDDALLIQRAGKDIFDNLVATIEPAVFAVQRHKAAKGGKLQQLYLRYRQSSSTTGEQVHAASACVLKKTRKWLESNLSRFGWIRQSLRRS